VGQAVSGEAILDDVVFDEAAPNATAVDQTAFDETALNAALDEVVLDEVVLDETALDETALGKAGVGGAGMDQNALDEALLDVVALAMAAPDPDGEIDYSGPDPDEMAEPARADTMMAAGMPEAVAPRMQAAVSMPQASPASPAPQSIGSALLANGFLEQHRIPANDPLAPIRRLSQAEKIALFS